MDMTNWSEEHLNVKKFRIRLYRIISCRLIQICNNKLLNLMKLKKYQTSK